MSGISRCCQENDPPLEVHYFQDQQGCEVVRAEVIAVFNALDQPEKIARYAEYKQRLSAACRGVLQFDEEIKPIHRVPDLWELKWSHADAEYRLYFGEPPSQPGVLVLLHFHVKEIHNTVEQTNAAQDLHINMAARRFALGTAYNWGMR
jgi:hypothetical protein